MPAISVVLPTRDRPAFVRHALASLAAQEFTDFEVIVADNPMTSPCEDAVAELGDERFRYLRADRPLAMHDNWEAGCAAARGDYIGVMIDKTVWLPSTMWHAMRVLDGTSADVLSWWSSSFEPFDEGSTLTRGEYFGLGPPLHAPAPFSGVQELEKAMSMATRRGSEGASYFRGKICFGLYRRGLMDRMRSRIGRLFPPIAPDYTSRVAALATATSLIDAGIPLQVQFLSHSSNGRLSAEDPSHARRFLEEIGPGLIDRMPIPGLYASHHNLVAHDYLIAEKLGVCELDRANLTVRAREDLALVKGWPDWRTRRDQYRRLTEAERRFKRSRARVFADQTRFRLQPRIARLADQQYRLLLRMPRVHGALRKARGKPALAPTVEPAQPRQPQPAPPDNLDGAMRAAEADLHSRPR